MASPKSGVFISHMTVESPVALVLQKYLWEAFGSDFRVFVSSDATSIGGGKKWFNDIIENLRLSQVVLVLVSQESKGRAWTNFEAGFGDGAACLVIPVSIKNFPLGQLSFPLSGYQGRKIDDIGQIVEDIAGYTGSRPVGVDERAYAEEVEEAESTLIYKTILVRPKCEERSLRFEVENAGNVDTELLMLEARIPKALIRRNWSDFGKYDMKSRTSDGIEYWWLACYSPRGAYHSVPPLLIPFLTPSMGPVTVDSFSIPCELPPTADQKEQSIFFQLHAIGYTTEIQQERIGSIPGISA